MRISIDGHLVTDREAAQFLERNLVDPNYRRSHPEGQVDLTRSQVARGLDRNRDGVYNEADFRSITGASPQQASMLWRGFQRVVRDLQLPMDRTTEQSAIVQRIQAAFEGEHQWVTPPATPADCGKEQILIEGIHPEMPRHCTPAASQGSVGPEQNSHTENR